MPKVKDFKYETYELNEDEYYEDEYYEEETHGDKCGKMNLEKAHNGKKPQWRADRRKAKLEKEKMQK